MKAMKALVPVALFILAATAVHAQPQAQTPPQGHQAHPGSQASQKMMSSMMSGMKDMQSMRMSGDTDRDFATMMRMHHRQAVEMAEVEVSQGKDEKMKGMARKMIEDQRKEIKQLDEWLASRK